MYQKAVITKTSKNIINERNDIRLNINSNTRNVIRYCNSLLKERSSKFLHFSAVGGSIGKLVSAIEVLKVVNSGLYQYNKLATVSYVPKDKAAHSDQKIFPKVEVILSFEEQKIKNDWYQQGKLDEKERKKLFRLFKEEIQNKKTRRGAFRGRRNEFHGRSVEFRGRRGTLRRRRSLKRRRRGESTFRFKRGGFRGNIRGRRGRIIRVFRGDRGIRRRNRNY